VFKSCFERIHGFVQNTSTLSQNTNHVSLSPRKNLATKANPAGVLNTSSQTSTSTTITTTTTTTTTTTITNVSVTTKVKKPLITQENTTPFKSSKSNQFTGVGELPSSWTQVDDRLSTISEIAVFKKMILLEEEVQKLQKKLEEVKSEAKQTEFQYLSQLEAFFLFYSQLPTSYVQQSFYHKSRPRLFQLLAQIQTHFTQLKADIKADGFVLIQKNFAETTLKLKHQIELIKKVLNGLDSQFKKDLQVAIDQLDKLF